MFDEAKVLTHSSIRIGGRKILYFDPFNIRDESHDADMILITHDHYDHYSPEDIEKIRNDETILVCPESIKQKISSSSPGIVKERIKYMKPWDEMDIEGINVRAIPAYNVGKNFHKKSYKWLGYVVKMDETSYYIAGDTDINEDVLKVANLHPDVALIPCGGTFTMDVKEASNLALTLSPKLAIPTHYGSIAGDKKDGEDFVASLKGKVAAEVRMRY